MIGFKEVAEMTAKQFADSPLGKMLEGKTFDKPMSEYDKPLGLYANRENPEKPEKKGGSYKEIKDNMESRGETGENYEVHHIPADSINGIEGRDDGPAIKMEKTDHRQTASCGNSKEAQEYRSKQAELVADGKFREAFEMDVEDIRERFGDKYDDAIAEAREYLDKLETEGRI